MFEYFKEGGYGMYPTALFGLLLIASSVLFLLRPEARYSYLMASLGIVSTAMGVLSFLTGVVMSLNYIAKVEPGRQFNVLCAGIWESSHNLVMSLELLVVAALVASAGAFRAARRTPAPGARA